MHTEDAVSDVSMVHLQLCLALHHLPLASSQSPGAEEERGCNALFPYFCLPDWPHSSALTLVYVANQVSITGQENLN